MASAPLPPPGPSPWPSQFAKPAEILAWLNTLQARDGLTPGCLLGLRWLVLAELDRTTPEQAAQPNIHQPDDLTSGQP